MSDSSDSEFKRLVGNVTPIKHDRVNLLNDRRKTSTARRPAEATPDNPELPSQHTIPASAVESYFDPGLQRKLRARIRSGSIRPEDHIDLHGMRLTEARQALDSFLAAAVKRHHRMLLVIHGQGYGSAQAAVLKPMVQDRLAARSDVLAWCPAQPADGAGGATYVYLKRI